MEALCAEEGRGPAGDSGELKRVEPASGDWRSLDAFLVEHLEPSSVATRAPGQPRLRVRASPASSRLSLF